MKHLFSRLSPAQKIILSFLLVIFCGSLLLSLPWVQTESSQAGYLDHLFTAVSMVCVTGLFTRSVVDTYNVWGQLLCMLLIQIGGLGILTFIGFFTMESRKKLSLKDRRILRDSFSYGHNRTLGQFVRSIFITTFAIEGLGALLLMIRFIPKFGLRKGIFNSIFLAVSAFCNAGFDNFGNDSLLGLQTDVLVNITLALLIITGGLGFMVWFELATKLGGKQKGLHFHTKVVLLLTAGLLVFGTVTSLWTEYNNPGTIGNLSFGDKLLVSFFQTVSMRTAGFASIDYTAARPVTLFIYLLQMFLGGAPGGTAGGLKITTFLVLLLFARKEILGLPHTNMGRRTLSPQLVQKAFGVTVIFQLTFLLGLLALGLVTDSSHRFIYLIFETVSALSTVGVTANITTLMVSLNHYQPKKAATLHYSKADIMIG